MSVSTEQQINELRIRTEAFIKSEVNFSMLHHPEYGRKHLELCLMQFAANESQRVAKNMASIANNIHRRPEVTNATSN